MSYDVRILGMNFNYNTDKPKVAGCKNYLLDCRKISGIAFAVLALGLLAAKVASLVNPLLTAAPLFPYLLPALGVLAAVSLISWTGVKVCDHIYEKLDNAYVADLSDDD